MSVAMVTGVRVRGGPGPDEPGPAELADRFRSFAADASARAPLYGRLSAATADDPDLVAILLAAPPQQRLPVLFFAALHDILLRRVAAADADDAVLRLASHYPNLASPGGQPMGDPVGALRDVVAQHRDELRRLVATRSTQTNEIGRCALFVAAAAGLGIGDEPIGHVDVGTSAGLNLLLDRYRYHYEPGGIVGGSSPVELRCSTRGSVALPETVPAVGRRIGLDASPVDVTDEDAVRWLEACVWPDQTDRFERLRAAIDLARQAPPDVRRGDAVADLAAAVDDVGAHAHPLVTTSWVLCYLDDRRRRDFVHEMDRLGHAGDLSWIIAESPMQTPGLPVDAPDDEPRTVVSLVRWRSGRRTTTRIGVAHPHGYWLHADA